MNSLPSHVLLFILKEINTIGIVTTDEIRNIARVASATEDKEIHIEEVVALLQRDAWIESSPPNLFQQAGALSEPTLAEETALWKLSDVALQWPEIGRAEVKPVQSRIRSAKDLEKRIRKRAQGTNRKGQTDFRNDLLALYHRTCMISGCRVEAALEAAHIEPYQGQESNTRENGLLLRADIHTLFDKMLLCVHPDSLQVTLAPSLEETEYDSYKSVVIEPYPSVRINDFKAKLAVQFKVFQMEIERRATLFDLPESL